MQQKNFVLVGIFLFFSFKNLAYEITGGEYLVSGGLGANVNLVGAQNNISPGASMPLNIGIEYAMDKNFALLGALSSQVSAGSVEFVPVIGGKYWFSFFNAPYVPYVFLGLSPIFQAGIKKHESNFKLGLSSGVGLDFFLLAKFLIGAQVRLTPSWKLGDYPERFNLGVSGVLNISFLL